MSTIRPTTMPRWRHYVTPENCQSHRRSFNQGAQSFWRESATLPLSRVPFVPRSSGFLETFKWCSDGPGANLPAVAPRDPDVHHRLHVLLEHLE